MDINIMAKRQQDRSEHREMLVQNLGIFELRALGRELGVQSPTTKKRDELIDLILDKIYNSDSSVVKLTKKGRPFKKLSNLEDIMSKMTGSDNTDALLLPKKPIKYEDIICFAQEVPVFSDVEEERVSCKGVVRQSEVIAYFIDLTTGKKIFIAKKEMEQFKLQEGDFIEAECKKINANNQYILVSVEKINFIEFKKYKIRDIGEGNPIISSEKYAYGDFNLYCGRRNLVLYKGNLFEDERFNQFAKDCDLRGVNLITLGLNTSFEDQILFKQIPNIINMTTVYGSGYDSGFNKVVDTIALTERLFNNGENCVLFINDIISLLNTLDQCFTDSEMLNGHRTKAVIIVQKLISLGRAMSNNSSITLVMTYRDIDKDDLFLKNELERVCSHFAD